MDRFWDNGPLGTDMYKAPQPIPNLDQDTQNELCNNFFLSLSSRLHLFVVFQVSLESFCTSFLCFFSHFVVILAPGRAP